MFWIWSALVGFAGGGGTAWCESAAPATVSASAAATVAAAAVANRDTRPRPAYVNGRIISNYLPPKVDDRTGRGNPTRAPAIGPRPVRLRLAGRKRLDDGVRGGVVVVPLLALGVVVGGGPRRQEQEQPRVREGPNRVALAGLEHEERPALALGLLAGGFDRNPADDHLDDGALADLVAAEHLPVIQVEDNRPALRRGEQHARHLRARPRHPRRVGSRRPRARLLRRGRQRAQIPASHGWNANGRGAGLRNAPERARV